MALFGTGFNIADPADSSPVSEGASWIRDLKNILVNFLGVSFNLDTGVLLADAIPNPVTTPYGAAGSIYTSDGPAGTPYWGPQSGMPIGTVVMWPVASLPDGYLACDGSLQLTAGYPALAAVLGMTYGGDGSTNFGLPNFAGRAPVGVGESDAPDSTVWTAGQKKGTETHALVEDELPYITLEVQLNQSQADGNTSHLGGILWGSNTQDLATADTLEFGGDSGNNTVAHNNLQPSLGIYFIIRAL